jgi:hypothetical protein
MKNKFILVASIALVILMNGCTNRTEADRVLRTEGFSDINYTGYDLFKCAQDDWYHTGFIAKNRNGIIVKGTVCSGLIKGATIRY